MTVPAYVLLNLAPTGPTSLVPGQFSLGNRSVNTFTALGLDIPTVAYGAGHTVYVKLQ